MVKCWKPRLDLVLGVNGVGDSATLNNKDDLRFIFIALEESVTLLITTSMFPARVISVVREMAKIDKASLLCSSADS